MKVKSIYESDEFPPAAIGFAFNLPAEARDAIRETLLQFDWQGTALSEEFGPGGHTQFVPIDYKSDWKTTRPN